MITKATTEISLYGNYWEWIGIRWQLNAKWLEINRTSTETTLGELGVLKEWRYQILSSASMPKPFISIFFHIYIHPNHCLGQTLIMFCFLVHKNDTSLACLKFGLGAFTA